MAWVHLTALLLVYVTWPVSAWDRCGISNDGYRLGDNCYTFRSKKSWEAAVCHCKAFGKVLAEPRNQKKLLRDLIKEKDHDYWIGLKRIDGMWVWKDNKYVIDHSDWTSGSPSNGTEPVCAYASACNGGKWAEAPCKLHKRIICMEKGPFKKAVGKWGNWGSCSKTCGTGIQERKNKGGQKQFQFCNTHACQTRWATCSIDGDPHYYTFDQQGFDFQGGDHEGRECKFLLAGRCKQSSPLPPFKILAANSHRGDRHVSWVKAIELHYNGHVIRADHTIRRKWFFQVDGVGTYSTPTTEVNGVNVTKHDQGLKLSIENELVYVTYNGDRTVIVGVKSCFKGDNGLCGLCGNYDGNKANDLYLRNGTASTSRRDLGWSYQEPDNHGRFCRKENVAPCKETNCRHAKPCDVLNDRHVFGSCPWYYNASHACAIDMCCAPSRSDICHILREYVKECARLGHKVPSGWEKRSRRAPEKVNCGGIKIGTQKRLMNVQRLVDRVAGVKFQCPRKDGAFPIKGSCTEFYACADGVAFRGNCQRGMHFSQSQSKCMEKEIAGCQ